MKSPSLKTGVAPPKASPTVPRFIHIIAEARYFLATIVAKNQRASEMENQRLKRLVRGEWTDSRWMRHGDAGAVVWHSGCSLGDMEERNEFRSKPRPLENPLMPASIPTADSIDSPFLPVPVEAVVREPSGEWRFDFMARLLPGVIDQKLSAFLGDRAVRILEMSDAKVCLQFGRAGWFARRRGGESPIELTIIVRSESRCAKSMTHIEARFRPLVKVHSINDIEFEVIALARSLRDSFLGHELELVA